MSEEVKEGSSMGNSLVAVLLAVILAGGGGTYYFYNQYQRTQAELADAKAAATTQQAPDVKAVVDKVGQLMELPADEQPTVASIKDQEKLKDHPFLSKGQNDDQLLIYTNAKMVVMYRPSTNKIVAVGTVTIQQASPTPAPKATPEVAPVATPETTQ